jgi:peroxiredoxin
MDKLGMVPIEKAVMAPDFTVKTVSGDTIKLSAMKGKVVLLNFWATW